MQPPGTYARVLNAERALVEELNESTGGRVRVSSPCILALARKPDGAQ